MRQGVKSIRITVRMVGIHRQRHRYGICVNRLETFTRVLERKHHRWHQPRVLYVYLEVINIRNTSGIATSIWPQHHHRKPIWEDRYMMTIMTSHLNLSWTPVASERLRSGLTSISSPVGHFHLFSSCVYHMDFNGGFDRLPCWAYTFFLLTDSHNLHSPPPHKFKRPTRAESLGYFWTNTLTSCIFFYPNCNLTDKQLGVFGSHSLLSHWLGALLYGWCRRCEFPGWIRSFHMSVARRCNSGRVSNGLLSCGRQWYFQTVVLYRYSCSQFPLFDF